jgi:hypothetical protein
MAQLHKTTLLAQWYVIWLLVEITEMPIYILRLALLTMMVAVTLSPCTALVLAKVML